MNGFEHAGVLAGRVEVGGGRNADGACEGGSEVGEDVCVDWKAKSVKHN